MGRLVLAQTSPRLFSTPAGSSRWQPRSDKIVDGQLGYPLRHHHQLPARQPARPLVLDRAARPRSQVVGVAVADHELMLTRAGEPGDEAGVDRLVAEPVADDDDPLGLAQTLVEPKV